MPKLIGDARRLRILEHLRLKHDELSLREQRDNLRVELSRSARIRNRFDRAIDIKVKGERLAHVTAEWSRVHARLTHVVRELAE